MSNSIAYTKNYTSILDAVYQRASVSGCLTSGRRMVRAGRNAKEIMIPKIEVSGLGDYQSDSRPQPQSKEDLHRERLLGGYHQGPCIEG